ncbi:MAG TPA: transglutaminase family protein, partial [Candidatus Binatia bacterium]|nr:transglutaminase family protein [Candidatus Binatia bacterium]
MGRVNRFRHRAPVQAREILYALSPAFGFRLFLLMPKAYWSRVRAGRNPFTPTLYERRRTLPKVSLEGRSLSQEPYLRPTTYCDSHAPEVVALADEIRHRSGGDWEYAQAAYDFVRNEIAYAFEPEPHRGVVGTLEAGCGICVDQANLLVALARAGGIPARYCTVDLFSVVETGWDFPRGQLLRLFEAVEARGFSQRLGADLRRILGLQKKACGTDNFPKKDGVSHHFGHPIVELKVGNFWIPADPTLG